MNFNEFFLKCIASVSKGKYNEEKGIYTKGEQWIKRCWYGRNNTGIFE